MREHYVRIIQCALSIAIGYALLLYFSDIPENRNARWVAAIIGGFAGSYALTWAWVRVKDLPLIVRRLTRAR